MITTSQNKETNNIMKILFHNNLKHNRQRQEREGGESYLTCCKIVRICSDFK